MKRYLFMIGTFATSLLATQSIFAQSTPAEFAEMSLQELFDLDIESEQQTSPKWNLSYQYKFAEFDGYLDGDKSLSLDEVLWSGPEETRTNKNFPVVPTVIRQRAHLFRVGYQYSNNVAFYLSAPYIKQDTDHISIVENYDQFIIETDGVGDTVLSINYKFVDTEQHKWWVNLGVSLPTGSIDELGDTPRAHGDQQLPYTMQLGSGTFDIPVEFNYQHIGYHDFSLSISAMLRTGTNDRQYRLGNNYRLSAKYSFEVNSDFKWFVGSDFQYSSDISGQDDSLLVDGAVPYPAGITNPALYGGRKISMRTGLTWRIDNQFSLTTEIGKPLYQNLNGPQPKETWRSAIQMSASF